MCLTIVSADGGGGGGGDNTLIGSFVAVEVLIEKNKPIFIEQILDDLTFDLILSQFPHQAWVNELK